jgi:hypothetical protein
VRREDLLVLMARVPRPLLRLHLTGGTSFDIQDPDEVVLTRSTVELLISPQDAREREAVISLLHIIWVEVIAPED